MFPTGYTHKNALPKRSVRSRTISDYSPFGVFLPERSVNTGDFRYGYNGKEKVDEIKGEGNSIDYGARIYDPRLGSWISVDPLSAIYKDVTPYCFVANSPILFFDPDGEKIINGHEIAFNEAKLKLETAQKTFEMQSEALGSDKKAIKALKEQLGLKTLEKEFNAISKTYEKAERIINTFAAVNPTDYNKFHTAKTSSGDDINIIIRLQDKQGPSITEGSLGAFATTSYVSNINYGTDILDADGNLIDKNIEVIPKIGENIIDGSKTYTSSTIGFNIQLFEDGQTGKSLSNELGDVKFVMEELTTYTKYKSGGETDAGKTFQQYSEHGAGKYSFDYQDQYMSDFKNYAKNNSVPTAETDGSGTLTNPPKRQ